MSRNKTIIPPPPSPPARERLMRALWHASGRKSSLDRFFTSLLKHRQYLPVVEPRDCIPQFEESEIKLRRCPVGVWSTPIIDVYVLIKAVIGFNSRRVLELGSYRGDTARLIAENTPDHVRICTVDANPDHGAAYRDTPLAGRIQRKVGAISPELFSAGETYDFIFVDADHDYRSVMNDTRVAFQVLDKQGVVFWHDYHFHNYFHGMAGVPEALRHFSAQHAILSVSGTLLGMCSQHPGWETEKVLRSQPSKAADGDAWQDTRVRG